MLALGPLGIGPFELILILAVVVIIFGVGRLPEVGGAIGRGIREFRKATKDEEPARQIPETSASAAETAAPAAPAPAAGLFCTNCRAKNAPEAKFCSECGTALPARVS